MCSIDRGLRVNVTTIGIDDDATQDVSATKWLGLH